MAEPSDADKLKSALHRQGQRMDRAQRERRTVLARTMSLGVLGLMFVLPVVCGAYLGRWLDGLYVGYSIRWTVSMIVLGVAVGTVNVYLQIRRSP
ncbi:MAG TPA: AtpZ/AtpI family protein [bacterium]|nr:AtpZ/AtpI family protein [bacterium]